MWGTSGQMVTQSVSTSSSVQPNISVICRRSSERRSWWICSFRVCVFKPKTWHIYPTIIYLVPLQVRPENILLDAQDRICEKRAHPKKHGMHVRNMDRKTWKGKLQCVKLFILVIINSWMNFGSISSEFKIKEIMKKRFVSSTVGFLFKFFC